MNVRKKRRRINKNTKIIREINWTNAVIELDVNFINSLINISNTVDPNLVRLVSHYIFIDAGKLFIRLE